MERFSDRSALADKRRIFCALFAQVGVQNIASLDDLPAKQKARSSTFANSACLPQFALASP